MILRQTSPFYQQCSRCVMDTRAPDIVFNEAGICSYCEEFEKILKSKKHLQDDVDILVRKIKKEGKRKKYDCIVGISGGVDSAYTLYKATQLGLRPLAVHMDNGWNSELAVHNIKNLITQLKVDLYTYVIDWEEYKMMMQCYFDADVVDIEVLYDNAVMGVVYRVARRYGVKYILGGTNTSTEGMRMPYTWRWFKNDKKNIVSIIRQKQVRIKTYPIFGNIDRLWYYLKGIRWIDFLDYLPDYNKNKAIQILKEQFHYKPYPYKHYESVFTRFYQGYILPNKFNIDKRTLHLSALIMTNQLSREEAQRILQQIPYESEQLLKEDIEFFLKKMGWTKEQLEEYIQRPPKSHELYGTEIPLMIWVNRVIKLLHKMGIQ